MFNLGKRSIHNNQKYLYAVGSICTIFWCIEPSLLSNLDYFGNLDLIIKIVRNSSLILLLPLVNKRLNELVSKDIFIQFLIIIYIFTAASSFLVAQNLNFTISVIVPHLTSALIFLILISINDEDFKALFKGVGLSSLIILLGLLMENYDFISTNFGRDRFLFGLSHPLKSASLVIAVIIYLLTIIKNNKLQLVIILPFIILLYFVSSRNIILFSLIFFLITLFKHYIYNIKFYYAIGNIFILCPFLYFYYAIFFSGNEYWVFFNELLSDRLLNLEILYNTIYIYDLGFIFGPNSLIKNQNIIGYANGDSIFITLFLNFGIIGFLLFNIMFYIIILRLASSKSTISFPAFCGLLSFYLFDSQGLTQANLPFFLLFSFVLRSTIFLDYSQTLFNKSRD